MIIQVGVLKNQLYLEAVLEKIQVAKKLFVMEVERGQEVFIPKDLSIKRFPQSFRFYDPIFYIIDEIFNGEKKTIYHLKTQYSLKSLEEKDKLKSFYKIIGVISDKEQEKMSFKQT